MEAIRSLESTRVDKFCRVNPDNNAALPVVSVNSSWISWNLSSNSSRILPNFLSRPASCNALSSPPSILAASFAVYLSPSSSSRILLRLRLRKRRRESTKLLTCASCCVICFFASRLSFFFVCVPFFVSVIVALCRHEWSHAR